MKSSVRGPLDTPDRPLIAISAIVFFLYVYFAIIYIWYTPYPGFAFTNTGESWQVNDSSQESIKVDDVIIQIDDLTFEEFSKDRFSVPFSDFGPGDKVSNIVKEDGEVIEIQMPEPRLNDRLRRLVATLWFFPFWLAGTAVLLFLRPRDLHWRLLIAFLYLIALWVVVGIIANWHVGASHIIAALLGWILVPVVLHLHLVVPSPLGIRIIRDLIPLLYGGAIIGAIVQIVPNNTDALPSFIVLGFAIIISIGLLTYRSFFRSVPLSDRNSARLMLAGIGLAFGPAILLVLLPELFGIFLPGTVGLSVAFISLPVLPISYTYAIYKRQLGRMEFRANRLLGLYSFILIYPTIFIIVLLFGDQWANTSGSRTFYLLFVSIIFVLATPPLLRLLRQVLNRIAYGTVHNPDDILRVFAQHIPSALTRDELTRPLTKDIMPAMLIRQSALCLYGDQDELEIIYAERIREQDIPTRREQLDELLAKSAEYLPPHSEDNFDLKWVRLAIPMVTREEIIGAWLFGRRDPDDFYPQHDVDLLQTLANQLTPVVENSRLYEALQEHADSLAEEVAKRTAELKAEKDRTQAILDSAGEGVFFTDPAGVILYSNSALALQSGYSAEELRGKTLELWQTEDDAPETYREMWTAIYAGRDWGSEMLLRKKDGSYCDVSLVIAPIHSEADELTGFVGVQSDISKLKEVDRVKSNIISSVSHELKTPLTTIKTYLMLIQRGKPEKRASYLQVLNRETDRLTTIIQDLLDLSKLDAGQIPSHPEQVNVKSAIEDVLTSCQARANDKHIDLQSEINHGLPPVIVDRNQLALVLTNLVVNALNYTPQGGIVRVSTGQGLMEDMASVWFRIADTGPGVDPIDLPHLFDRFYRGQAALESGEPGSGLGLAICREIVERHNGRIEVESKLGDGTAFTFWLPADTDFVAEQIATEDKIPTEIAGASD